MPFYSESPTRCLLLLNGMLQYQHSHSHLLLQLVITLKFTICYHFKILFNMLFQIRWTVTFTFFRSRKVCHFICHIRIEIYSSFFSISSINLQTSSWISSSTSSFGRSRFWFTLKSGCWYFEGILFVLKLE